MSKDDVTDLVVLRARLKRILRLTSKQHRPCRLCGEMIYLLDVEPKPTWYSESGDPHQLHCERYTPKHG